MKTGRNGFTLIEMLVVLVVIGILAGLVFRMMSLAGKSNEEANTHAILEKVANAIEAYRAEYGRYPPVATYPGNEQPMEFEYAVRDEGKSGAKYMTDAIAQQIMNNSRTENIWSTGRAFTFGLASYFFPRYYCHGAQSPKTFFNNAQDAEDGAFSDDSTKMLNQWWEQNKRTSGMAVGDQMRDMMAAQRILPHIDAKLDRIVDDDMDSGYSWKVSSYGIAHRDVVLREYNGIEYYNSIITFRDGWDRALHYSSKPPYDKYELWSSGADGTSGTEDDIYAGQE